MAIKLENKTRVQAPDSDFPYGKIKDTTPTAKGTPLNEETYGDFHQFFAKLLAMSGVIANGLLESAYSGFQYIESLLKVGFKYFSSPLVNAMISSYVANDVLVLSGVVITLSNSNNTATWTKGSIYYNGKTYLVSAGTTTKSSGVFIYTISDEEESIATISHGVSNSGIADYLSSTVKYLYSSTGGAVAGFSLDSSINLSSATFVNARVVKNGRQLTFSITLNGTTVLNEGFKWTINIPEQYKPKEGGFFAGLVLCRNTTDNVSLNNTVADDDALTFVINSNNQLEIGRTADGAIGSTKYIYLTAYFTCEALH